jgi:TolB-like protein/DNA-binding winged helix-turn-helix (wHTH) protein/Flp pilus assembly protein TadD
MHCVGPNNPAAYIYSRDLGMGVKFIHFPLECAMASKPTDLQQPVRFGEGYELDLRLRRLRRGRYVIRMERIPLEILILLVEHQDEIVNRDEIVSRVWGKGVFFDTDNSIRGAIRKLRQALKDDAGSPRFIQTVTGQGYRFIAPVTLPEELNRPDTLAPEPATVHISPPAPVFVLDPSSIPTSSIPEEDLRDPAVAKMVAGETVEQHRQARRWLLPAVVLALFFALAGFAVYRDMRNRASDANHPKLTSIGVMPLKNLSGDPAQEFFADGMTEEVIGRLSMIRGLRVISRTSVMQFKNTRLLTPEIARTLGVDAVVEGSVIREGDRIRVHAQLIRASTDEHFWSETYDRELGDALTLESEIAESIARRVQVTVTGEERARLVAARPVSPEVYELYLKGLFDKGNSRAEVEESIGYFDQAIKRDPTFAPAYAGLADGYGRLGTIFIGAAPDETRPKVISNAQKALELDPQLGNAYVTLANVHTAQWRWAEAEVEFRRALELNPNHAGAHFAFATWMLCHGRVEEALAWGRRGRELDPVGFTGDMVWSLMLARRQNDAIQEARNVLAVKPEEAFTLWGLGWALIFNNQAQEAIPVLEKAISITHRSPGVMGALVWAYARAGRRTDALRLLEELKKRQRIGYVPAGAFLVSYLGLRDKGQAYAWLEPAVQEQSNVLKLVKVFPVFDEVRDDPRFQEIVRPVGLN